MEDPGGLDGSRNEFTVTMESAFDWVIRDAGDDTGSRGEDTAGIENDDMENYDDAPSSGALPAESEDLHLEDAGPERVEEEIIVAQPVADKPSPNSNADESGYRREEMEPDQVSNNDRADDADRRDETGSSSGSSLQDLVVLQDDSPLAEENGSWGRDDDLPPDSGQLEVQIPTLAVSLLEEYSAVLSEVVDYVNNVNTTSKSCEVEFTDGRIETVSFHEISQNTRSTPTQSPFNTPPALHRLSLVIALMTSHFCFARSDYLDIILFVILFASTSHLHTYKHTHTSLLPSSAFMPCKSALSI